MKYQSVVRHTFDDFDQKPTAMDNNNNNDDDEVEVNDEDERHTRDIETCPDHSLGSEREKTCEVCRHWQQTKN